MQKAVASPGEKQGTTREAEIKSYLLLSARAYRRAGLEARLGPSKYATFMADFSRALAAVQRAKRKGGLRAMRIAFSAEKKRMVKKYPYFQDYMAPATARDVELAAVRIAGLAPQPLKRGRPYGFGEDSIWPHPQTRKFIKDEADSTAAFLRSEVCPEYHRLLNKSGDIETSLKRLRRRLLNSHSWYSRKQQWGILSKALKESRRFSPKKVANQLAVLIIPPRPKLQEHFLSQLEHRKLA